MVWSTWKGERETMRIYGKKKNRHNGNILNYVNSETMTIYMGQETMEIYMGQEIETMGIYGVRNNGNIWHKKQWEYMVKETMDK